MSLIITDAGITASIKAGELGVSYKITHIGIGRDGYAPSASQTELKNEIIPRKAITRGAVHAPGELHFEVVLDGNSEYDVKEIGYYLEDGTLFAVDSRHGEIMSLKRSNTIITEAFELNLAGSSIENITVEIMGAPYATEHVSGTAKIASSEQVSSGSDDSTIITPKKLKDNAATDSDIDNVRSVEKHIYLPQFWRGITKKITAAFNGREVNTEGALQGGGALSKNRTLSIKNATTKQKGAVQLSDSVKSTSSDLGATSKAVNIAHALALQALNVASQGLPIGIPLPWPLAIPPEGWLESRGQTFNKATYPGLAITYPSGRLPDLRGEFIRGWDNGRGIDIDRNICSWQVDELKAHTHKYTGGNNTSNAYANSNNTGYTRVEKESAVTGGSETRPRNIAYMYIVRAA